MVIEYFTSNFMTLTILLAIVVLMIANGQDKIPMSNYFTWGIVLLVLLTVTNYADEMAAAEQAGSPGIESVVKLRTVASALGYMLRPVVILIEVLVVVPGKKYRPLFILPAVINAAVYATAFFGSKIAFWIDSNNKFGRGPLGFSVFIAQLVYVFFLFFFSAVHFKRDSYKLCMIVFLIFLQAITVAMLEITILPGYANQITALGMLEYYFYLSVVYQHEMRETIMQKEIDISKANLLVLRNQIHPHFIYNSLSIIRSLVKHDSKQAVSCIDEFAKYLKSHISAIQSEELIPFEKELENMKIYLSLAQVDYKDKIEVIYDMDITDFLVPPLSLEPVIENAVEHGAGTEGGKIAVCTCRSDNNIIISISNNISEKPDEYKLVHNGIGLDNTRRRIELQCRGSLELEISDDMATVTVTLPTEEV